MRASEIQTLFRYNDWANRRLLACAGGLPADALTSAAGFPFGSLHDTFAHLGGAERLWLMRCRDRVSPSTLAVFDVPRTFAEVESRLLTSSAEWQAYVDGLADADLDGTIAYANTKGDPFSSPLWQILTHVSLHGMQHRAEIAALLTAHGASPGDIDFIRYLREAKSS